MSDNLKDGGPAFPQAESDYIDHPVHGYIHREQIGAGLHPGMSMRDWFAGQALVGFLSQAHSSNGRGWSGWGEACADHLNQHQAHTALTLAEFSYQVADAMLRARIGETSR